MLTVKHNIEIPGVRFLELIGKPTDADIEAYAEYELKRIDSDPHDERVLVLVLHEVWSSTQRKRMKDVEKEMMRRLKGRNLGMAMVVPNSLLRGTFTAYFWISPPAYPTRAVPTAAAALSPARSALAAAQSRPMRALSASTESNFSSARMKPMNSTVSVRP